MEILMNPDLIGFSLEEANYARKIIGKKKMDEIPKLKKMIYDKAVCRQEVVDYLYKTAILPQLGYSFSRNHTMPYTAIALQELNIFHRYPQLYWNTACLTVNAGADDDGSTDYAKIATAIGDMQSRGIKIALPNINKSNFNFKPSVEEDRIYYGLKGLSNVGSEVVHRIIESRPYNSLQDFMTKCPLSKTAMISLVKSGSFDSIENKDRFQVMEMYLKSTMTPRSRVTLQNMPLLIQYNLLDSEVAFERSLFEFNRYLKEKCKNKNYYSFDDRALVYFSKNFDESVIELVDNKESILISKWERLYDKRIDTLRQWLNKNKDSLLNAINEEAFKEEWDKYALGNLASWEMDSVCLYYSFHELDVINQKKYGIKNFEALPESPVIESTFKYKGRDIPIFETSVIAGTILGKDKIKATVSVLTTSGVAYVKFRPEQFAYYDQQLSEKQDDGSKKIMERSWFKRGKKVLLTGYRRGNEFVPKTYKHTSTESLYLIDDIDNNGELMLRGTR